MRTAQIGPDLRLRSFSQVREIWYISTESTYIKTTGNLMQLPLSFSVVHIEMYTMWGRKISMEEKTLCCLICKIEVDEISLS